MRTIQYLILACLIASCCAYPDGTDFIKLPLDGKINALRQANKNGCSCEGGCSWYDNELAKQHGSLAARAMVPYLVHRDPDFPQFQAAAVVNDVARNHGDATVAVPALKALRESSSDSSTQSMVREALQNIELQQRAWHASAKK